MDHYNQQDHGTHYGDPYQDPYALPAPKENNLHVQFRLEPVHQTKSSEDEGRPIYKDIPYIRITFPGDRNKIIDRPVDLHGVGQAPSDPRRFPRQWAAFQAQTEQVQDGWAITEWPRISKSQALEFKGLNIHTVEALADIQDGFMDKIGLSAVKLRDAARSDLAQAKDGKEITRLTAENETLRLDLVQIKAQLGELSAEFEKRKSKSKGE